MSNTSSLAEIVKATLKELRQGGLQQIFSKVKDRDPNASKHMVRKILTEGGFAEQRLGEITVARKDTPYKKKAALIWVFKDLRAKTTVPPAKTEPSIEVMIMPRRPREVAYRVIEEIEHKPPDVVEFQDL